MGKKLWTDRDDGSGEFMAQKKTPKEGAPAVTLGSKRKSEPRMPNDPAVYRMRAQGCRELANMSDDADRRLFWADQATQWDAFADKAAKQQGGRARHSLKSHQPRYIGRPENKRRNTRIASMLASGASYSAVQEATGCSRATVAKIAKRQHAS